MEQYTIEERAKIVELYFSNQRSIILTQRAYRRHFNMRVGPSQSTINRLVANLRKQGAVGNLPGAGRRRTVHTRMTILNGYRRVFGKMEKHQPADVRHNLASQEGRCGEFFLQ